MLVISEDFIQDMAFSHNGIESATIVPNVHTKDTTLCSLTSFAVDLDEFTLTLNFDETVDASTFEPTAITLQAAQRSTSTYTLTGGDSLSEDGLQIVLNITVDDMNKIKENEGLLIGDSTSWITMTEAMIKDMSANLLVPIQNGDSISLKASEFSNDSKRPRLTSFDIDMTKEELTFVFPEIIDVANVDFGALALCTTSAGAVCHTLEEGEVKTAADSTTIVLGLTLKDLNILKQKKIGRSKVSTWLAMTEGAFVDQTSHKIMPLKSGINSKRTSGYVADSIEPFLRHSTLISQKKPSRCTFPRLSAADPFLSRPWSFLPLCLCHSVCRVNSANSWRHCREMHATFVPN
jgi:hypothetical protein